MSNLMSESSIDSRKKETEDILEDILVANPHLITLGAKRYFRRVWIGYAVLALAVVVGIWAFTNKADNNLRRDINRTNTVGCLSSIRILNKYNDFVEAQIQTLKEARKLNLRLGAPSRARLNQIAIDRYKKDKIVPPTVIACNTPLLK